MLAGYAQFMYLVLPIIEPRTVRLWVRRAILRFIACSAIHNWVSVHLTKKLSLRDVLTLLHWRKIPFQSQRQTINNGWMCSREGDHAVPGSYGIISGKQSAAVGCWILFVLWGATSLDSSIKCYSFTAINMHLIDVLHCMLLSDYWFMAVTCALARFNWALLVKVHAITIALWNFRHSVH